MLSINNVRSRLKMWVRLTLVFILLTLVSLTSQAQQTFNSGSTGADGNFTPTTSQTITPPPSGIFNYINVDIPSSVAITYRRNADNTPVVILASGNVTINGTINIAGENGPFTPGFSLRTRGGAGGPAGYDGGGGGNGATELYRNGTGGDGPGGGGGGKSTGADKGGAGGGGHIAPGGNGAGVDQTLVGSGGNRYGSKSLLPLIGGSGGGGAAASLTNSGVGGGGGGGAILIAVSGTLTFGNSATIFARGGTGTCAGDAGCCGGGAGGVIRLIATTIVGGNPGTPALRVEGGFGGKTSANGPNGGDGSPGFVRIEAYNFNTFAPSISPNASAARFDTPGVVALASVPTLRITSVAGVNVPAAPKGTFGNAPDIPFTTEPANPVTVELQAANIPLGTVITLILTPESGVSSTVQSTPLAGALASSTATASVTLPQGRSLLNATVTIEISGSTASLSPKLIDGERVQRVEIAAAYGAGSQITYITETGKRIKARESVGEK